LARADLVLVLARSVLVVAVELVLLLLDVSIAVAVVVVSIVVVVMPDATLVVVLTAAVVVVVRTDDVVVVATIGTTGRGACAGGVAAVPDEPSVSLTNAAVKPASEITMIATATATYGRQRGASARRVRAAVPQFRHQSWSARRGAPHSGHSSAAFEGVGAFTEPPAPVLTRWLSSQGAQAV
jgi:hypothetical protein